MKIGEIKEALKDKYKCIKQIDNGGNSTVYSAICINDRNTVALKVLDYQCHKFNEKKERFIIETIKVIEIQDNISGIVPIYDFALPDINNSNLFWYTMPIATTISEYISQNQGIENIIKCIISLAEVLVRLHNKDIKHRDIKPANIYYYNSQCCLGDFGLVDYPEKTRLTKVGERLGPQATIAPEMKRDPLHADAKKADVYSLAKSMWMLLTSNDKDCFEGTYNPKSSLMSLNTYYKKEHLIELNQLLIDSTQDDPALRPTMSEFLQRIKEYLAIYLDYEKSTNSEWKYIQEILFNGLAPETASFSDIKVIIRVLNLLGSMPRLNHMFLPTGGGHDFTEAEHAAEEGCISINASGAIYILKPKTLIVENIKGDFSWSYFRLELDELKPIINLNEENCEFLTEHLPGEYISWKYGNYGYYEDKSPLPKQYRLVSRLLNGSFVFFSKVSIYNRISGTYDKRHNLMSVSDFRGYIIDMRDDYNRMRQVDFMEKYNKSPFACSDQQDDFNVLGNIKNDEAFLCFIETNYSKWNFKAICDEINSGQQKGSLVYFIELEIGHDFFAPDIFLSENGTFLENNDNDTIQDIFKFNNFQCAINAVQAIETEIGSQCIKNDIIWCDLIMSLSIELSRVDQPTHLFTKDELKKVLLNGDDSKNNVLVIDGEGYVKLVENPGQHTKSEYPVFNESFNAFNNYVGEFTPLYDLDDMYISFLRAWLYHLEYNKQFMVDHFGECNDEEELLNRILKHYN